MKGGRKQGGSRELGAKEYREEMCQPGRGVGVEIQIETGVKGVRKVGQVEK